MPRTPNRFLRGLKAVGKAIVSPRKTWRRLRQVRRDARLFREVNEEVARDLHELTATRQWQGIARALRNTGFKPADLELLALYITGPGVLPAVRETGTGGRLESINLAKLERAAEEELEDLAQRAGQAQQGKDRQTLLAEALAKSKGGTPEEWKRQLLQRGEERGRDVEAILAMLGALRK